MERSESGPLGSVLGSGVLCCQEEVLTYQRRRGRGRSQWEPALAWTMPVTAWCGCEDSFIHAPVHVLKACSLAYCGADLESVGEGFFRSRDDPKTAVLESLHPAQTMVLLWTAGAELHTNGLEEEWLESLINTQGPFPCASFP